MSQPPDRPIEPIRRAADPPGEHPEGSLAAYVDGSASASASELVETHLAGCERCRDDVRLAREALAALRGLPELRTPWEDSGAMGGAIGRAIAGAEPPKPRSEAPAPVRSLADHRNRRRTGLAAVVGLAAAASVAALVVFVLSNGGPPVATSGAAPSAVDAGAVGAVTQDGLAKLTERLAHGGSASTEGRFAPSQPTSSRGVVAGGLKLPTSPTIAPEAAGGVPCARRASGQSVSALVIYAELAQFQGKRVWVVGFVTTPTNGGTPRVELVAVTTTDCTLVYVGRQAMS